MLKTRRLIVSTIMAGSQPMSATAATHQRAKIHASAAEISLRKTAKNAPYAVPE